MELFMRLFAALTLLFQHKALVWSMTGFCLWALLPSCAAQTALPRFGFAVGMSTLGAEVQAATAVTSKSNLRFGFNDFSLSDNFSKDGLTYHASLTLRSAEILYDQYVKGPFHISSGLMIYDGNKATGAATTIAGQSFNLGGTTYFSQAGNTISASGSIGARTVSP